MEYFFKDSLDSDVRLKIIHFYQKQNHVFINQHPDWNISEQGNIKIKYFIASIEGDVVCFAKILIRQFSTVKFLKYAEINGGPLCSDKQILLDCIKLIVDYCKSNRCMELKLKLPMPVSFESEYIEVCLQKDVYPFISFYNKNNFSTLQVDLTLPVDQIKNEFSTVLKKNLKAGLSKNITVREIESDSDIQNVLELYKKMLVRKKLNDLNSEELFRVIVFIKEHYLGKVLASFKENGTMIGGAIIIFQGARSEYYIGFSDPDEKKLPVSHSILFEAIIKSKELGYKYFDLGGYNHYATEKDQVYYVNLFKANFSSNFVFYPKEMHFIFIPYFLFLSKAIEKTKYFISKSKIEKLQQNNNQ